MMDDAVCIVVSAFVLVAAMFVRPQRAVCPPGWHNEGIRPSGSFVCKRNPIGPDHRDAHNFVVDDSIVPPGELHGWIACDGVPVVDDDRVVRCMPRDFVSNGWR